MRAHAREVGGGLDRQCMYLAREGERDKGERERARHGVQWRVYEVNTFGNRVEKRGLCS